MDLNEQEVFVILIASLFYGIAIVMQWREILSWPRLANILFPHVIQVRRYTPEYMTDVAYTSVNGDADRYRTWLQDSIGKEWKDWIWDADTKTYVIQPIITIRFRRKRDLVLFTLAFYEGEVKYNVNDYSVSISL